MPNRTAKFLSAVFASLVAGTALTSFSHAAPPAADDCLAGPKDHSPQGAHWYYRIEHPSNRHCWYLKNEHDKAAQAAAPNAAPPAKPTTPAADAAMPRSIADARAELPSPPTPRADNGSPANAPETGAQRSIVGSRWLDPTSVGSSAGSGPITGQAIAAAPSSSTAAQPAIAAVPLATADALPDETGKPSGSFRIILLAIIGALSLAGVLGSAIFRFGGTRPNRRRGREGDRRAIWDSAAPDRRPPPVFPDAGARMRQADIPREADDPDRRIAEMLAQLSRRRMA